MPNSNEPTPDLQDEQQAQEAAYDGWKATVLDNPDWCCRICGSKDVWYRSCDCADYDDTEYHCRGCGRRWCEGADA
jgi:hypothetical protein